MVALSQEAIAVDRFVHQDELMAASNHAIYGGIYGGRFSERRQSSLFKNDDQSNSTGGSHNKTSFNSKSTHNSSDNSGKSSKNNSASGRKGKKAKTSNN